MRATYRLFLHRETALRRLASSRTRCPTTWIPTACRDDRALEIVAELFVLSDVQTLALLLVTNSKPTKPELDQNQDGSRR